MYFGVCVCVCVPSRLWDGSFFLFYFFLYALCCSTHVIIMYMNDVIGSPRPIILTSYHSNSAIDHIPTTTIGGATYIQH